MGREEEEIRYALGVIDDHRRLIAAGKTQRWDIVKWAVTINIALTAASIALRQQKAARAEGLWFFVLACAVAILLAVFVLEVNRRMTRTRADAREVDSFLEGREIDVSAISKKYPETCFCCLFWYDWPDLLAHGVILFFSILPTFLVWCFWN